MDTLLLAASTVSWRRRIGRRLSVGEEKGAT